MPIVEIATLLAGDAAQGGVEQAEEANKIAARAGEDAREQAEEAIKIAARGVDVAEEQGEEANKIAVRAVDVAEEQGEEANEIAARAVDVAEEQGEEANEIAGRAVEQAEEANEIAARAVDVAEEQGEEAIDAFNQQASEANATADEAARQWERAVDSFEGNSEVVANAVDLWSPSIDLVLRLIGPLQVLSGFNYFTLILKNLGLTPAVPESIRQLDVTNTILQDMAENYREVEMLGFVNSITPESIVHHEAANTLTAHFFFTQNNMIVQSLLGQGYLVYDSIETMLKHAYCWNAFLHAAGCGNVHDFPVPPELTNLLRERNENLKHFDNRCTKIYFLDPAPKNIVLPKVEFFDIHKDVVVINNWRAKDQVKIEYAKIYTGCSVHFEYLTIGEIDCEVECEIVGEIDDGEIDLEIDGTCAGKAQLKICCIGWDAAESGSNVVCYKCEKIKPPQKWRKILKILGGVVSLVLVIGAILFWLFGDSWMSPPMTASPSLSPTASLSPSTFSPTSCPNPEACLRFQTQGDTGFFAIEKCAACTDAHACDSDIQCKAGLACYTRSCGQKNVPGCLGDADQIGTGDYNFCVQPPNNQLVLLGVNQSPSSAYPLRECAGGCDNDNDCADGLFCFERNGLEDVPGCTGAGQNQFDYCFNPGSDGFELLAFLGDRDYDYYELGQCEGDCDFDSDCEVGLVCYEREGGDNGRVPTCVGNANTIIGFENADFCIPRPNSNTLISVFEYEVGGDVAGGGIFPIPRCAGDCDSDIDCQSGLTCFQRSGFTAVPGCSGTGEEDFDYCI